MSEYLIDKKLTTDLMSLAGAVLRTHFFYDDEGVERFCIGFAEAINHEHTALEFEASDEFIAVMTYDPQARTKFTAELVGFHIMATLDNHLHFSADEMKHFDNIMMKYIRE